MKNVLIKPPKILIKLNHNYLPKADKLVYLATQEMKGWECKQWEHSLLKLQVRCKLVNMTKLMSTFLLNWILIKNQVLLLRIFSQLLLDSLNIEKGSVVFLTHRIVNLIIIQEKLRLLKSAQEMDYKMNRTLLIQMRR